MLLVDPTGHQQSKVGFASLLLVGVFSNPSDLEEEKNPSGFFDLIPTGHQQRRSALPPFSSSGF
jgi:hypothetical protein